MPMSADASLLPRLGKGERERAFCEGRKCNANFHCVIGYLYNRRAVSLRVRNLCLP